MEAAPEVLELLENHAAFDVCMEAKEDYLGASVLYLAAVDFTVEVMGQIHEFQEAKQISVSDHRLRFLDSAHHKELVALQNYHAKRLRFEAMLEIFKKKQKAELAVIE